jgi:hypothetical protein
VDFNNSLPFRNYSENRLTPFARWKKRAAQILGNLIAGVRGVNTEKGTLSLY